MFGHVDPLDRSDSSVWTSAPRHSDACSSGLRGAVQRSGRGQAMAIESSGHSRGNPRIYELIENAPRLGRVPRSGRGQRSSTGCGSPVSRSPGRGRPISSPGPSRKRKASRRQSPRVRAPSARAPRVRAPRVRAPRVRAPRVRAPRVRAPRVRGPSVRSRHRARRPVPALA